MVCRNKGRAEAARDEIVEQSKNQVRSLFFLEESSLPLLTTSYLHFFFFKDHTFLFLYLCLHES